MEKIDIKYASSTNKDDGDVATETVNALKASWELPSERVTVKVEKGWITLGGELEWNFQSEAATRTEPQLGRVQ